MPSSVFMSDMHGERTRIEVFTRVPDNVFHSFTMGQLGLIVLRCGTVSIRRDISDIRARPNRILTFIHQVSGRSTFRHYGNQIEMEEGDFTLCNNSTEYDLRLEGPNEVILFRVPTAIVADKIPSPDVLCGRRLARDEGLTSMAGAVARDIVARDPSQLQSDVGERAGRHLLEVLASSYSNLIEERNAGSAFMSARFWKVKLFIEEHLREPELSPSYIARRLQLSDRYLRMIFAVSDESPSTYILRRRLEECASQLRDPCWRHYSITNIAFGWGFNSAPHFARCFRARYLCTPRDYRQRYLAQEGNRRSEAAVPECSPAAS